MTDTLAMLAQFAASHRHERIPKGNPRPRSRPQPGVPYYLRTLLSPRQIPAHAGKRTRRRSSTSTTTESP